MLYIQSFEKIGKDGFHAMFTTETGATVTVKQYLSQSQEVSSYFVVDREIILSSARIDGKARAPDIRFSTADGQWRDRISLDIVDAPVDGSFGVFVEDFLQMYAELDVLMGDGAKISPTVRPY